MAGYLLEHNRALGDVLVMSALVRDLYLTTGEEIAVKTSAPALWLASKYCRRYE
jgi:Glycosyltransferase family 9 (heptosyltransferase)